MVAVVSIKWCGRQERGITLIEPNDNLAQEYFDSAEQTLDILKAIEGKSNMWLAATKYYCEYFAVYALLMKIGVKPEMHECSIALSLLLERECLLPKGAHKLLSEDKQLRIDNQYYLKNRPVKMDYSQLVKFVLDVKSIANKLTHERRTRVRNKIKELMQG